MSGSAYFGSMCRSGARADEPQRSLDPPLLDPGDGGIRRTPRGPASGIQHEPFHALGARRLAEQISVGNLPRWRTNRCMTSGPSPMAWSNPLVVLPLRPARAKKVPDSPNRPIGQLAWNFPCKPGSPNVLRPQRRSADDVFRSRRLGSAADGHESARPPASGAQRSYRPVLGSP